MKPFLAQTLGAILLPLGVIAEPSPPSAWETFANVALTRVIQIGLTVARSQFDLTYDDLSVDFRSGRATLTGMNIWPFFPWEESGADTLCQITIGRVAVAQSGWSDVTTAAEKIDLFDLGLPIACLPEAARISLEQLQITSLRIPQVTIDLRQDMPSGGADLRVFAMVEDLAAITLTLDLEYLSLDKDVFKGQTAPWVGLASATLDIENRGIWNHIAPMLPPHLVDPGLSLDTRQAILTGLLPEIFSPVDASGPAENLFIQTGAQAWHEFLATPQAISLSTGFDPSDPVWLEIDLSQIGSERLFHQLMPRLDTVPVARQRIVPHAVLAQFITDKLSDMTPEQRRVAALALWNGEGAPRNRAIAKPALQAMAMAGDTAAAMALAQGAEKDDPKEAYGFALVSAAQSASGALAMLDRLERRFPLDVILKLQENSSIGPVPPHQMDIGTIRTNARARFLGTGKMRNYERALYWATLGAATMDGECLSILADLDALSANASDEGARAWAEIREKTEQAALERWMDANSHVPK